MASPSAHHNPSSNDAPAAGDVFPCFARLPAELRLMVWEAAVEETMLPRVFFSHAFRTVRSELHGDVKAIALTCWEAHEAIKKCPRALRCPRSQRSLPPRYVSPAFSEAFD